MRSWLIALVLLLGAGATWWGAGMPRPGFLEPDGQAGAPRLRTATLDRGSITAVVAATGTVNPVTLVQVGSQLSGQIRELLADFNSKVKADQPIAQLDTATLEARRASDRICEASTPCLRPCCSALALCSATSSRP
jgi:HlyD family secretion protein